MTGVIIVSLVLFAYVTFLISRRAFIAYKNGWKTWPLLALLAVLYVIFGIIRRFFGLDPMIFIVGSLICIYASRAIFASSRRSGV
jgi:hypothetical protein